MTPDQTKNRLSRFFVWSGGKLKLKTKDMRKE